MNLVERYGRAVLLLTALVALAGAVCLPQLSSSIYPQLEFPRILILARGAMLPPRAMTLAVTRPLEEAVMEVPGLQRVRSRTLRGVAEIAAQFAPGTDMEVALQRLRNQVDEARRELPDGVELTVERLTLTQFPMLSFNLTGGLAVADLRDAAFYVVRPELARVPGVGRVEVLASDSREIEVVADPGKLLAAGLTLDDLVQALRSTNLLSPVGRYEQDGRHHLVLASGLFRSLAELAATPVLARAGAVVRVGDVATVFPGAPDRTLLVAGNGHEAAVISLSQQPEANVLAVQAGVDAAIHQLAKTLPSGLVLHKVYDLAELVRDSVAGVRDAILIGGALAVLILLLFLRDGRLTALAALTLPLTVLSTFLFLRLFGESINLMSMGGLAVAIGLVIDDAVVVVENLHRQLAAGGIADLGQATAELVAPLVSSTLTTIVVLTPLGLLSGVAGQLFRSLSLTLGVAVLLSLGLALGLIPLLARAGLHAPREREGARQARWEGSYGRSLAAVLRRPRTTFGILALLAALAAVLLATLPTGFLPQMDEGGFVVDYRSPPGTGLEETGRLAQGLETVLAETPEVAAFSRRTGSELGLFATEPNKGDVLVRLKPHGERRRSAQQIIAALRPRLQEAAPDLEIEIVELLQDMVGDLEGAAAPIEVKIFGDDPVALARLAQEVKRRLAEIAGVVDVTAQNEASSELIWQVDAEAAGRLGLSVEQVSQQLATAWSGEVATELRLYDRGVPVRARYPDADRFAPERLAATTIRGSEGRVVPLSALAQPVAAAGEGMLMRENLRAMALVTARLEGRDLGGAVAEVQDRLAGLSLPVGSTLEVGGQLESQRTAFRELLLVFAVAAALVLLVLVLQFRAFTPALLILATAPLSLGGALLLLWGSGGELDVSAAMGVILLVGLAVKNGIVLLDYAHRRAATGEAFPAAVVAAAEVRLRPILMTTLCTLFGLAPLALGLGVGAEMQRPLALVVIGGLALSTLVTLYLLPSAYVAIHRWRSPHQDVTS